MELLERESALATLRDAVGAAAGGDGRCVLIEGPAGIGKTSLLRAAREAAADLRVLTARAGELEQTLPYGVVRQLFERVVARAAPADREALLAGAAALAGPLLGAAGHPAAADEESTFAVQHGLYWLAANLADRQPLLLAVDDLHWADAASSRWLAYLARRLDGLPVLVLATVRPATGDGDPALADLLADPATVLVRPAPLSREAATVVLRAGDAVTAAAHEATGGNPLLLREIATALAAGTAEDAVSEVRRLAPAVVARRVRLSLAKLGDDAGALARAVAVLGDDDAGIGRSAELAGLDAAAADAAAAQLARAEVLHPGPPLRFVHPLVRQAVYDTIPEAGRLAAHRRAADLLAADGAPADRVAAQLVLAPPAGNAGTVARLREVARQAVATGAPESARTYLQRALQEPTEAKERAGVLVELAGAESLLGTPSAVEHLGAAVELVPDRRRRAGLRHELARALLWRGQEHAALAQLESAQAEAPDDPALARRLDADLISSSLRLPDRHAMTLDRLAELRVDGDDDGARELLALKAYGFMVRGERREEAVTLAQRALAGGLPSEHAPSWSLWGAVSALLHADCHEPALRVVDEALANARRRGAAYLFCGSSAVRASILQLGGRLIDAEADARASVDAVPDRGVMVMPLAYGVLAEVLVQRGRLDEAAAVLAAAGGDGTLPESFGAVPLRTSRAALRLATRDFAGAAEDARAAGRALEAVGFRNPALARWRGQAALALAHAGEVPEARRLAAEELALARRWGSARAVGAALRVSGIVAGGRKGVTLLRESCAVLEAAPAAGEHARSALELGAALRRAGERVEARDVLRTAADLARRCGAELVASRAHEELLAAGAKPRTTALSGVEALTPSERRIAAMAAEGMGNREIAQALFVTLRTVEMHLSGAFRKLDIASRTQLAEILR